MTWHLMTLELATPEDATEIALLRSAVAVDLTRRHGTGHWSAQVSEAGVLRSIQTSRIYVMRQRTEIVGTLRLAEKKPWAIDPAYFFALLDGRLGVSCRRAVVADHRVSIYAPSKRALYHVLSLRVRLRFHAGGRLSQLRKWHAHHPTPSAAACPLHTSGPNTPSYNG